MATEALVVKVSAPGKVILHGEHSVVYGKLAIAASLDLRTTVILEEMNNGALEINFIDLKFQQAFDLEEIKAVFKNEQFPLKNCSSNFNFENPDVLDHDEFLNIVSKSLNLHEQNLDKNIFSSLSSVLYLYFGIIFASDLEIRPLLITVKTDLSLGSGTGSSASLMVSLAGSFIYYAQIKAGKITLDEEEKYKFTDSQLNLISKWSFRAEKIIHGNPSGIDNTVCTYGSLVSFRKARAPFAVKTSTNICGILIDTKIPKNTALMVQKVAELKQKRPKVIEHVLNAIEDVTDEALEVLVRLGELKEDQIEVEESYNDLADLSTLNHDLLRVLGVSHPTLDAAVQTLHANNLAGKMTGSGGGGYALSIISPSVAKSKTVENVCEELKKMGYEAVVTKLGGDGVRVE